MQQESSLLESLRQVRPELMLDCLTFTSAACSVVMVALDAVIAISQS